MSFIALLNEPGASPWTIALGALIIFFCRVCDMSIDSIRIMSMVRGYRVRAAVFGLIEAAIFIYAISQVLAPPMHWAQMLGYAAGFAVGTYLGTLVAEWLTSGFVLVRILSIEHAHDIAEVLRDEDHRVTELRGEGKYGPMTILFSVMDKRLARAAIRQVQKIDPDAFVIIENIEHAVGGYIPHLPDWGPAVRH